jgi:hypothetical protein
VVQVGNGAASLRDITERVAALGDAFGPVARDVADAVRGEIERTILAGKSSEGEAWALRQDGATALRTAGKSLRVAAIGAKVLVVISGHIARHHLGTARGRVTRAVIPVRGIPGAMALGMVAAANRVMSDIASGRRG